MNGDECQQNHDSNAHSCSTAGHLSVTSLLEDVESSDLQFHSVHLTNRSPSHEAVCMKLFACASCTALLLRPGTVRHIAISVSHCMYA